MKNIRSKRTVTTVAALALAMAGGLRADDVVHVTQSDAMKAAKEKVQPEYPSMARQLHLEGAVQVEAHITETGTVDEVKPLTGNAVLMNAAVAAMKRWKFTPFVSDGKPARAVADVSFSFHM